MAEQQDYDTPWKEALALYLPSFFEFFFPEISAEIDWSRDFKLLDKELRKLERDSATGNREADTLVEVHGKDGKVSWALVHIEVQSQVDPGFLERMVTYHFRILDHYRKPVTSLAVLGDTNPTWRPSTYQRTFLGTDLLFHFPVVKLLDYQSQLSELEVSTNPFALLVAATLHVQQTKPDHPKRREAKFRLIRGLLESGLDRQKILAFFRLVDWIMTLSPEEDKRFQEELADYEQETKHMPYITSIERMGIEKGLELGLEQGLERGLEQGRKQGLADALISVLSSRFSPLPESLPASLLNLENEADLKALLNVAVGAATIAEFEAELAQRLAL